MGDEKIQPSMPEKQHCAKCYTVEIPTSLK